MDSSKLLLIVNIIIICVQLSFLTSVSTAENDPATDFLSKFPENGSLLQKWEPPGDLKEKFVYYLCGYTDENTPVWVAEWGKWDVKKILESGDKELISNYDKYVSQMGVNFFKSIQARSTPEDPVKELIWIIDMDNFAADQLSSTAALTYNLHKLRELVPIARAVDVGFLINTNYVAETIVNLARPIFGASLANFQIYGTNKNIWVPRLLKEVPRNLLPEAYGGTKDFKPVQVYG